MNNRAPEPIFGDIIENIHAAADNPWKRGVFVEAITRRGRLNPGLHYRCTDRKGHFWELGAESARLTGHNISAGIADPEKAIRGVVEAARQMVEGVRPGFAPSQIELRENLRKALALCGKEAPDGPDRDE
jgi:hypothetical protein